MATITRTKSETVATVTSVSRKITVSVSSSLTVEESRELRGLLKAEEVKAAGQSVHAFTGGEWKFPLRTVNYFNGIA